MALISGIGSTTPTPSSHTRTPDPQVQHQTPVTRSREEKVPASHVSTASTASMHKVDVKA